jgi:hypothetical protein
MIVSPHQDDFQEINRDPSNGVSWLCQGGNAGTPGAALEAAASINTSRHVATNRISIRRHVIR